MEGKTQGISRRALLAGTTAIAAAGMATSVARATEGANSSAQDVRSEQADSTMSCDIVICGAGAAGLWAGVEASRAGAHVIVVEKGASLAMSCGSQAGGPLAVGSKLQQESGEGFTVQTAFQDIMEWAHWSINAPVVKECLKISGETVDLFQEDFGEEMALLPDSYGVGYRVRCVWAKDGQLYAGATGEDRMQPLADEIVANGGQVLMSTEMTSLVQDESGAVAGIMARGESGTIQIDAKAVLVATGGFQGNPDMILEKFGTQVLPLGNTLSVGTGYEAMKAVGAAAGTHWGILGNEFAGSNAKDPWSFANSNPFYSLAIQGGLYVNRFGRRFTDEGQYAKFPLAIGGAISLEIGGYFYGVYDQATIDGVIAADQSGEAADKLQAAFDAGWGFKADTLEELAEITGAEDLAQTVNTYNEYCARGTDADFYKDSTLLVAQSTAPFYAFQYQPSCWATEGGVKTNDRLQVIDTDGAAIPGLYCAGVDNGSILMAPYHRYEGTSLCMAFNTGRLAGKYMAEDIAK